ncbi:hypothetical protein NHX12_025823 [Muraenolepis orangiensis]|uniref:Uncharacterized protein n=1 Tax=Muraenolepis orangiensis TaxID=630683 RepID=A0A9Q0EL19_9TELE|nr:hypothetical protein NHX12_025823 [Muraenolepis orangiensis]
MEILSRLFPYGKTLAGLRKVCELGHLFVDTSAARARGNITDTWPSVTIGGGFRDGNLSGPGGADGGGGGGGDGDPCSLLSQTQAAQMTLQRREAPSMPRMAMLLAMMGVGMSSYSCRQLTLHCKPAIRFLK